MFVWLGAGRDRDRWVRSGPAGWCGGSAAQGRDEPGPAAGPARLRHHVGPGPALPLQEEVGPGCPEVPASHCAVGAENM